MTMRFLFLACFLPLYAYGGGYTDQLTAERFGLHQQASAPATPASGYDWLYILSSDGSLYVKDSAGIAHKVLFGGNISGTDVASGYYLPTTTDESAWNGKQAAIGSYSSPSHEWVSGWTGSAFTSTRPACADLSNASASCATDATNASNISSGTLPAARLPTPTISTLGGMLVDTCLSHNFVNATTTSGDITCTQPSFSDVTGTLGLGAGGTGQTTASGAFTSLYESKATTLGDLIYGGASGAPTRLPGNTTSTKNFACQTGTGTVSAAPSWCTIASGDVPTLNQNTTGSAGSLSSTFGSGVPLFGQGTGVPTVGTVTGNTTKVATSTGSLTSGDCAKWDASGNIVDAGAACGSGSGTSLLGNNFGDAAVTITPSAGFGTTSGTTMKCRRNGDSVECYGKFTDGTVAASSAYIDIGSTWTIDTAKVFSGQMLGTGISIGNGGSFNFYSSGGFSQVLFYDGTTATRLYFGYNGAGGVITKNVGSDLNQSGGAQQFHFVYPVSGWTAN